MVHNLGFIALIFGKLCAFRQRSNFGNFQQFSTVILTSLTLHLHIHGVGLGRPYSVARLTLVLPGVLEVCVAYHQRLAVVLVLNPVQGQRALPLAPLRFR